MDKKVNAIIQARMGSTRLPGKVLMEIEGIPILEHIVNRLSAVEQIGQIIVATSVEPADDPVARWCDQKQIAVIRGSEENVLDRFRQASEQFPADIYIRATGDNPMIDVGLISSMLKFFDENDLTYTCYKNYPLGSGVEIFTSKALEETIKCATESFEKEHVTPYMYQKMEGRKVEYYTSSIDESDIRMTVDTEKDLLFAKTMYARLFNKNPFFGISDISNLLEAEPELRLINNNVHQKKLGE